MRDVRSNRVKLGVLILFVIWYFSPGKRQKYLSHLNQTSDTETTDVYLNLCEIKFQKLEILESKSYNFFCSRGSYLPWPFTRECGAVDWKKIALIFKLFPPNLVHSLLRRFSKYLAKKFFKSSHFDVKILHTAVPNSCDEGFHLIFMTIQRTRTLIGWYTVPRLRHASITPTYSEL